MALATLTFASACTEAPRTAASGPDATVTAETVAAESLVGRWSVRTFEGAPARFRPQAWSSETLLWGLVRGRVARLNVATGELRTFPDDAWWVTASTDVVAWRNERGVWMRRGEANPELLAPNGVDTATGFDGPASVHWSPDGERALLRWEGEWDSVFDLLERDGSRRRLKLEMPGFFGKSPSLWLGRDSVLFEIVASAPRGGEPTYRESGWRGALAVLDLRDGSFSRVADVPDRAYLRGAGLLGTGVLVTWWSDTAVVSQLLYDRNWRATNTDLPAGRAFAARGGVVVVLTDPFGDSTQAVLVSAGGRTGLGRVARDGQPAFTPSGERGAMLTSKGLLFMERVP